MSFLYVETYDILDSEDCIMWIEAIVIYLRGTNMLQVKFYENVEDRLLKFAVIVSKCNGQWVFCKHKDRDTYECPGGHREPNENIDDTAKRELWEETGAADFDLRQISVYSVCDDENETYGMLYYADIYKLGILPALEIEKVVLLNELPCEWTYPLVQPKLIEQIERTLKERT